MILELLAGDAVLTGFEGHVCTVILALLVLTFLGCMAKGSCDNTLLRKVLRRVLESALQEAPRRRVLRRWPCQRGLEEAGF